jgi:hypothetical protein
VYRELSAEIDDSTSAWRQRKQKDEWRQDDRHDLLHKYGQLHLEHLAELGVYLVREVSRDSEGTCKIRLPDVSEVDLPSFPACNAHNPLLQSEVALGQTLGSWQGPCLWIQPRWT